MNSNHISDLWRFIQSKYILKDVSLDNFKSNGINFKIATWNPQVNGIRYLKMLLYNLCQGLNKEQLSYLNQIKNREVGNPFRVNVDKEEVCFDYFQVVNELTFLKRHMDLNDKRVIEIGAGYGRTCHGILSTSNVSSYLIADLPNCLALSKKYLKRVLSEKEYNKIEFLDVTRGTILEGNSYDLAINIDSFNEMKEETVREYLCFIGDNCKNLYVKNPVGKYINESLDNHYEGKEIVKTALNTGILRQIVDVDNDESIAHCSKTFVTTYTPSGWTCAGDSWAPPISYYWQAFYENSR